MQETQNNLISAINESGTFGQLAQNCWPGVPNAGYAYLNWYPSYSESKTEKAYKIVRALMKAKIVKVSELDKFFDLMDKIQEVL